MTSTSYARREVRDALDDLLRNATLTTLALGIALGWTLLQVAEGVSALVSTLLTEYPSEIFNASRGSPLTWDVGGRVLTLGPLLFGLLELGFVLLVTLLVVRRRPANAR